MGYNPFYYVDFYYFCPSCKDYIYKHYEQEKCKKCMKIQRRVDTDVPVFFERKRGRKTDRE